MARKLKLSGRVSLSLAGESCAIVGRVAGKRRGWVWLVDAELVTVEAERSPLNPLWVNLAHVGLATPIEG